MADVEKKLETIVKSDDKPGYQKLKELIKKSNSDDASDGAGTISQPEPEPSI